MKKRILSLLLALSLVFGLAAVTGVTVSAEIVPQEPSTENGVYQIGAAAELYWFAKLVNGTLDGVDRNLAANAELTANITVNSGVLDANGNLAADTSNFEKWVPIAQHLNSNSNGNSVQYTGTFDGKGYTISGLFFNDNTVDYVGLFGFVGAKGKVSNVGVVNSYFNAANCVGGVCGQNADGGNIIGCYNEGEVDGEQMLGGEDLTFESAKYVDVKYEAIDESGAYIWHDNDNGDNAGQIAGSIVGILESTTSNPDSGNIARDFVGRGYIKVKLGDKEEIFYANYAGGDIENNTRSLASVAQALKADMTKYNGLNDEAKALVDNWASKL